MARNNSLQPPIRGTSILGEMWAGEGEGLGRGGKMGMRVGPVDVSEPL